MNPVQPVLDRVDRWQRRTPVVAVAFAVDKKFSNDRLNLYVVALGWYGFLSIYPLLLVVVTIFGFIGVSSLGTGIVSTLHQFPVVGSQFNPENPTQQLHGSSFGLVIGLLGLLYGTQGVMQTAQGAMEQAWNVPLDDRPGFLPRLGRSMLGLAIIGGTFLVNAALSSLATGSGHSLLLRVGIVVGMLVLNILGYGAAFRCLTPTRSIRDLIPGVLLGAFTFTALITVGSGLVQHQLRHSSSTYGQFGAVIGLVGVLLLMAKLSLYGAELNPVLRRRLWPRALVSSNPTAADDRAQKGLTLETTSRKNEVVSVEFGDQDAATQLDVETD
ncbi:MAG TPA: YhjD/YihY/BrkB family envelope integrity protein [Acidimicrobiales bacterium]|jgi:uncharacterized BrkB/YihY/UPF0761 family membrane protein